MSVLCLCPALLDTETDQDKEVSFSLVMDSAPAAAQSGARSGHNKIKSTKYFPHNRDYFLKPGSVMCITFILFSFCINVATVNDHNSL